MAAFGALTTSPDQFRGTWMHEGQRFEDEHFRLVVDIEATPENRAFLARFKERLKERFRQIDIGLFLTKSKCSKPTWQPLTATDSLTNSPHRCYRLALAM